jgi:hypothetical protein
MVGVTAGLPHDAWHYWTVNVGDTRIDLWGAGPCHAMVFLARELPDGLWVEAYRLPTR